MHEGQHHSFEIAFAHLTVADDNARGGHQLLNTRGDFVDGLDAVVHEVNLATALQLDFDGRADEFLIVLGHHGLNGHAVLGRRLNDAHIAQAHKRHMQRARNRRGRHGEHVNFLAHLLQALLVAHAEALLLVDDEQAEILELDVFREQPVGADEDVDLAGLHLLHDELLFLRGAEARDHLHLDGKLREAFFEGLEVLKAEHGGGREHGDLLAILHGFESGAHSDFGFAIAHIAA